MEEYKIKNVKKIEKLCVIKEENKYSPTIPKKIDDLSPKYPFYRKIRKDGNCYYRAVMFRYMEKVIALGPKEIQSFINLIESDVSFFEFEDKSIRPILKSNLEDIKKIREEKGAIFALKCHYQLIREQADYDLAFINMLRSSIATFIEINDDLKLNGLALYEAVDSIESYIEDIVLKNGELAQTIILNVAPIILRIGINVVILTNDSDTDTPEELYSATHPDLYFNKGDSLDLHEKLISVIFYSGNYNAIYSKEDIEQYPELACYDDDNLQCAICHKKDLDMMRANLHSHIAHHSCFMESLEKNKFEACPICGEKLELKDIELFASDEEVKAIEKFFIEEKASNEPKKIEPKISSLEEGEKCLISEPENVIENQPHSINLDEEEKSTPNPPVEEIEKNPEEKQRSDNPEIVHSEGKTDQVSGEEENTPTLEEVQPQRQQPSQVIEQSNTEEKKAFERDETPILISEDPYQEPIQEEQPRNQANSSLSKVIIGIHYQF